MLIESKDIKSLYNKAIMNNYFLFLYKTSQKEVSILRLQNYKLFSICQRAIWLILFKKTRCFYCE